LTGGGEKKKDMTARANRFLKEQSGQRISVWRKRRNSGTGHARRRGGGEAIPPPMPNGADEGGGGGKSSLDSKADEHGLPSHIRPQEEMKKRGRELLLRQSGFPKSFYLQGPGYSLVARERESSIRHSVPEGGRRRGGAFSALQKG